MKELQTKNVSNVLLEDTLKPLKAKREMSEGRLRIVAYKRINTALLTPQWIVKKFKEKNAKETPNVIKMEKLFLIQYPDRTMFALCLEDGKLYHVSSKTSDKKEAQKQASIFLEIIRERVEGFRMRDIEPIVKWE